ncbi:MAG: DNA repair protein RecN [Salinisphaera sp.]|nr:DNA repair protein RecN [Salinisphaera sp.]
MLSGLAIADFAIIDDLNLALEDGMTVLSGETGAGKSILIDALGLLLGDRADADAVREGQPQAQINAVFTLDDAPAARAWLAEQGYREESECKLRRMVARAGRNRTWINGQPATVAELRALGERLVDIHGQHAHQTLLQPARQRELLDACGDHGALLADIRAAVVGLRENEQTTQRLQAMGGDGAAGADLLRYQVDELRALDLAVDELPALETEHRRLAGAERLIRDGGDTLAQLYEGENAALDLLGQGERRLRELAAIDPQFEPAAELVSGAGIQLHEAADALRRALTGLEADPARLQEAETRLAAISELARKHRCQPEELPARIQTLEENLATLDQSEQRLAELAAEHKRLTKGYTQNAQRLHQARKRTAARLGETVTAGMRELGMPQGQFEIQISDRPGASPSIHGADQIGFLISANPGQASRPLQRVASGGELSRISLAIQMAARPADCIPTLVFDEVDAGIGGAVAEIVGRQLRRLGARAQVLCVTHLPQIAAQAAHHLHVAKQLHRQRSRTLVSPLNQDNRVDELARMLGGLDITAATRAHALEMIELAAGHPS